MIDTNAPLQLSDGTPVEFVKTTSKGNIQVRLPDDHDLADDPYRIFRTDGSHYKDALDVTLENVPDVDIGEAVPGALVIGKIYKPVVNINIYLK